MTTQNDQPTRSAANAPDGQTASDTKPAASPLRPGEMTFEDWRATYQPIRNPGNPRTPYGGIVFWRDWHFNLVREVPLKYLWSLSDCCGYHPTISPGIAEYGCIGYFITKVPAPLDGHCHVSLPEEEPADE